MMANLDPTSAPPSLSPAEHWRTTVWGIVGIVGGLAVAIAGCASGNVFSGITAGIAMIRGGVGNILSADGTTKVN